MANTVEQTYEIPIIAGDLRRAEFAKQMADALDHIENISQNVFNRIAVRLNAYRAQLNKFDERIQHVSGHIERIRGSNRAIQIHSSARYPVEQNRSIYKSIFEVDPNNDDLKPPVLIHNSFRLNENIDRFIDPNDPDSKSNNSSLIVFNQHIENYLQKTRKGNIQGLGKPPSNIKSVVSLLTYNTKENPYTKPTKIDPLSYAPRRRQENQETTPRKISEALPPKSNTKKPQRSADNGIGYNPTLGQVPQFSLPDNLTELGNFATFDNESSIEWTQEQMGSIAPSLLMSMLPDISELSSNKNSSNQSESISTTNIHAPPPPPDLPAIVPLNVNVQNSMPNQTTTSVAPPPPQPPPPSLFFSPPNIDTSSSIPKDSNETTFSGGSGNPLLDAITGFNKDKLRSPKQKEESSLPTPTPVKQKEPENLMDALKPRLDGCGRAIMGESGNSSSNTETKTSNVDSISPPTGNSFIGDIMKKAQDIKKQMKADSDESSGDDDSWK